MNGTPGPLHNKQYQMPLDQAIYYVSDSHGNRVDIPAGTVTATPGQPPASTTPR